MIDAKALASRIAQVHSDAGCEPDVIERYHVLRRFTQSLMEECWKMNDRPQFNFDMTNVHEEILESLARRGAAFEDVYGVLDVKAVQSDANWTTEPHIQHLRKHKLITGQGWYMRLTPLGVQYCKAFGFYISTRFELLMPKLSEAFNARAEHTKSLKNIVALIEHDNRVIEELAKELMAVDGKDNV